MDGRLGEVAAVAIEVALEIGDPVGWVLADKISEQASPDFAGQLLERCEARGIGAATPLREFMLASTRRVLEGTAVTGARADESTRVEFLRLLNNLALRQSAVGRQLEALESLNLAQSHAAELAEAKPGLFLLALTHHNLGMVWQELGQHVAASNATAQAVAIRRELARPASLSARTELASSLNNLSFQLGASGRPREALEVAKQAVDLLRELAKEKAYRFDGDLATAVNTLSQRLVKLGKFRQAAAAADEAVELLRLLASERPERFEPELATALHNLGSLIRELEDPSRAVQNAMAAVRIQERLYAARPGSFRSRLASCLVGLGSALVAANRPLEALERFDRAIVLFEGISEEGEEGEEGTETLIQSLAVCRIDRSAALYAAERIEEGLSECSAALAILKQGPGDHGDHLQNQALALAARGTHLARLRRGAEALADAEEVVLIYRRLCDEVSAGYRQALARSLESQGRRLLQLGRIEEASLSMEQAIELYRARRDATQSMCAEAPGTFSPRICEESPEGGRAEHFDVSIELVGALCRAAPILRSQGRVETLVGYFQEAILALAPYVGEFELPRESLTAIGKIYVELVMKLEYQRTKSSEPCWISEEL